MAGIRIVPFMGMLPRVADRLLVDGGLLTAERKAEIVGAMQ